MLDILKDPKEFLKRIIEVSNKHNLVLKFKLVNSLKRIRLLKYRVNAVLLVPILKVNGKQRVLQIFTLKDRVLQNLLKIIMESYLEPLGDRNSFGVRPGRTCHQAIAFLHNKLHQVSFYRGFKKYEVLTKFISCQNDLLFKRRGNFFNISLNTASRSNRKISKINNFFGIAVNRFLSNFYLLDVDLKGSFSNICHSWLLKNIPIPKGYSFLLSMFLQPCIVEWTGTSFEVLLRSCDNLRGIPFGNILAPLLINWVLDGIENVIRDIVVHYKILDFYIYYNKDKFFYWRNREPACLFNYKDFLYFKRNCINLETASWVIRYLSFFIVGIFGSEFLLLAVKKALFAFLLSRGLCLFRGKTKVIKWSFNAKINFLGWTCHYLFPKRVSWIIKIPKKKAGNLRKWVGVYTYPSIFSVQEFKFNVKVLTSKKNSWRRFDLLLHCLCSYILMWSSYFSPAPLQSNLRLYLDRFIYMRLKRFWIKKYGFKNKKRSSLSFFKSYVNLNSLPCLYALKVFVAWSAFIPSRGSVRRLGMEIICYILMCNILNMQII